MIISRTDQHSSRLAVSDAARRYLVPAIDCGGLIEGTNGWLSGQIIQLATFGPDDPYPVCRGMIDLNRVKQELMPQTADIGRITFYRSRVSILRKVFPTVTSLRGNGSISTIMVMDLKVVVIDFAVHRFADDLAPRQSLHLWQEAGLPGD